MAKRHHSSGSHVMVQKHGDLYSGMDNRRRQEMEDAGMIHEDHRAIANLPQEVMIKPYPYAGADMPDGLDDTILGIDKQINVLDDNQRRKTFHPKKV